MAKTLKTGKVQDLSNGNGGSFHTHSHRSVPFRNYQDSSTIYWTYQGAKKVSFTAYHSSKPQPTFTSPRVILISQEKSFEEQDLFQTFFCNVNFLKKIVCPSGKLRTKFTSLIAKSTSPRLLDMTFFAHCILIIVIIILTDIILSLLTSKNLMHISSAKFKEWNFYNMLKLLTVEVIYCANIKFFIFHCSKF